MACQACVSSVRRSLEAVRGVSAFEADLEAQTVTVESVASVEQLLAAISSSGRDARFIGQGSVAGFDSQLAVELGLDTRTLRQSLAAVTEFKGESWGHGSLVGVVRLVQLTRTRWRVEASLEGLRPGRHTIALHEYGDLTRGVDSTGRVLNVSDAGAECCAEFPLLADETGCAKLLLMVDASLQVWDLIGRALVVSGEGGSAAAVLARSAVAGDNTKKVCACDGTVIWAAGDLAPIRPVPKRAVS